MQHYVWEIENGLIYSTAAAAFVTDASMEQVTPLYSDTSDPAHKILADKAFLRETLLFYGFPVGEAATLQDLTAQFESGVDAWLDAFARTRAYRDIVSAASYGVSKNASFRAEAEYAADLRDRTWEWSNAYQNAVLAGQKSIPTWESFVVELTEAMQPEWPVPDTRLTPPVGG